MVILAPIISGFLLFWVRKGDKPDTSRIGFQENLNSKDTTSVISVPNFIRDLSYNMPQHKGAERRVRLSEKRRIANKGTKITMRKLLKDFDPAAPAAGDSLKKIQSTLDRLARKGIVKKNYAANKKSKLARSIKKATA